MLTRIINNIKSVSPFPDFKLIFYGEPVSYTHLLYHKNKIYFKIGCLTGIKELLTIKLN